MTAQQSTTDTHNTIRSFSQILIGGKFVDPSTSDVISVVSPVTEQEVATVPAAAPADVDAAVAAARKAFDEGPWPRMTPAERAEALLRVRDELAKRIPELVDAFSAELGAPRGLSEGFHNMALRIWEDAASLHERVDMEEPREWDGTTGTLVKEPVGVVGVIVPWNGPVPTASLKFTPALAAGCTVVVKGAEEAPVGTHILAEAVAAAELPEGVVSIMSGGRDTGRHLVAHRDVDAVSFTGSTTAGREVMASAAARIARVTLELGGKSAGIVADDIAIDRVVPQLVGAGVGHTGQVCAAITRVLVPRARQDEIVEAMAAEFRNFTVGGPEDPNSTLGPVISERQRDRVEDYIRIGIDEGARLVTGGGRPADRDRGWFVQPTLFADVRNDMRIAQEEIFGPVICVIPFDSIDEAVAIANDSEYGLSGAVFAEDDELAQQIARRIRTGQVGINGWDMCVLHNFGGFKQSGLGREGGLDGMSEFLETKLIQKLG
ncbi:aldehyde dehydrogenase family protein [Gordonia sp. NPDC127522]|uniref:aldehyde dehydrogenase family protein n=1 Tax=Gordonia sp. NPDC127522 TaxID=3345390 RepID=UPI00362E1C1A